MVLRGWVVLKDIAEKYNDNKRREISFLTREDL